MAKKPLSYSDAPLFSILWMLKPPWVTWELSQLARPTVLPVWPNAKAKETQGNSQSECMKRSLLSQPEYSRKMLSGGESLPGKQLMGFNFTYLLSFMQLCWTLQKNAFDILHGFPEGDPFSWKLTSVWSLYLYKDILQRPLGPQRMLSKP